MAHSDAIWSFVFRLFLLYKLRIKYYLKNHYVLGIWCTIALNLIILAVYKKKSNEVSIVDVGLHCDYTLDAINTKTADNKDGLKLIQNVQRKRATYSKRFMFQEREKNGNGNVYCGESFQADICKFKERIIEKPREDGYWHPATTPNASVVILTLSTKRNLHTDIFLSYMHEFLQRKKFEYQIIIIEQTGREQFNRGLLFNMGVLNVPKSVNCFILTDIDLLPERFENIYNCNSSFPRHLSSAMSRFEYSIPYTEYFGGTIALSRSQLFAINGFSNRYWGWGGEDDDLYNRVKNKYKIIDRVDKEVGRFFHIPHTDKLRAPLFKERIILLQRNYNITVDGLNNAERFCTVRKVLNNTLYQRLIVKCSRRHFRSI